MSPTGRGGRRDRGSAVIEFIVIGVGVLVPIAYLALAAATVQTAAYASTQAAREAARAFSSSATEEEGRSRAHVAARLAFSDHGLQVPPGAVRVSCPDGPCLDPGSSVAVDVAWSVPLLGLADGPGIGIEAHHRVPVDDYRGSAG